MALTEAEYRQRIENINKIAAERRAATHCLNGHPFTEENTYWTGRGLRNCRICRSDRAARQRTEKKIERMLAFQRAFGGDEIGEKEPEAL